MTLIERPNLEIRDEELLAAQAIARISGAFSVELIDSYIAKFKELREFVAAGNLMPICPELTNTYPSAAHTALLETMTWLLGLFGYRINQVPDQNVAEFARLFRIELREATKAETVLQFTVGGAIDSVTIPVGTRVETEDKAIAFETTEQLVIPFGQATGTIAASAETSGHILLSPNKLTRLIDNIASVVAVTNLSAIDSGSQAETIESALERMRQYQRRAERIVSDRDLEEAILSEALDGNGIVRAFPFVRDGFFSDSTKPGHTTVIVMTGTGDAVDVPTKQKVAALFAQLPGNLYYYIADPVYIPFNITVRVKLSASVPQNAITKAIEDNLRAFYAPARRNFGRRIFRSEIIAVVEQTTGVDYIFPQPDGNILGSPAADIETAVWELPKLVTVTIEVI
jgi:hypothetical protein